MKKTRFTESQRMAIIAKQESGESVDSICRANQISPATFYKWKKALIDQEDDEKRVLKALEQENTRLKKMYAELKIDYDILEEGYKIAKKISARSNRKK